MVHTAEFYAEIEKVDTYIIQDIEKLYSKTITMISNLDIKTLPDGVYFHFLKFFNKWRFYLVIDFMKMLNKNHIYESDYNDIEKNIEIILKDIFSLNANKIELNLKRIDFRKDITLSLEERELLLKLYKKTKNNYKFTKKKTIFDSTIYFENQSLKVVIYDKEKEQLDRKITPIKSDVMRLEVRLFPKHLAYKKKYGFDRTLKNYLKNDVFREYLIKKGTPLIFFGNHYKIEVIIGILKMKGLKPEEQKEIKKLLNTISKYGYDSITKSFSYYKIRKYLNILRENNINPLIIPGREEIDVLTVNFFN